MHKRIIFIMGVSGSGKTTAGKLLAQQIDIPFFDGDDYHTAHNKEKMKAGIALNDEDRIGWLNKINQLAQVQQQTCGAIIACSALKDKYREILNQDIMTPEWIFLQGSYEVIFNRMKNRKDHFMPPHLLQSQFDSLEIPTNMFTIDIDQSSDAIVEQVMAFVNSNIN